MHFSKLPFIVITIIGYFYVYFLLYIIDILNCEWLSICFFWIIVIVMIIMFGWFLLIIFILMIMTIVVVIIFIMYSELFFNHEHGWHGIWIWKTPGFQTNMNYTKLMLYFPIFKFSILYWVFLCVPVIARLGLDLFISMSLWSIHLHHLFYVCFSCLQLLGKCWASQ